MTPEKFGGNPQRRDQDLVRDNPLLTVLMENQNRVEGKIDALTDLVTRKAEAAEVRELLTRIIVAEGKLDHRASVHHDLREAVWGLDNKMDALMTEVAMLKVKSGLWGAAAGLVPAAIIAIVSLLGAPNGPA